MTWFCPFLQCRDAIISYKGTNFWNRHNSPRTAESRKIFSVSLLNGKVFFLYGNNPYPSQWRTDIKKRSLFKLVPSTYPVHFCSQIALICIPSLLQPSPSYAVEVLPPPHLRFLPPIADGFLLGCSFFSKQVVNTGCKISRRQYLVNTHYPRCTHKPKPFQILSKGFLSVFGFSTSV